MGSKGNVVLLVTLVTLVIVGLVWFGLGWLVGWLVVLLLPLLGIFQINGGVHW